MKLFDADQISQKIPPFLESDVNDYWDKNHDMVIQKEALQ